MKAILFLLAFFSVAIASAQNTAFEGFMYDEEGKPVEYAYVRALNKDNLYTETDTVGHFSLSGVAVGDSLLVSSLAHGRTVVVVQNPKRIIIKLSLTKQALLPITLVDYSTKGLPSPPLRTIFGSDTLFKVPEQSAMYPGGAMELVRFLAKTITYPTEAAENNIQGLVEISFVINKNGDPRSLKIIKSLGYGCDEEVMKAVLTMPRWYQGIQNSKAVEASITLPIHFSLKQNPDLKTIPERLDTGQSDPLFILNGVVMKEYYALNHVNSNRIDRIEIIKGKAGVDQFGEQGQNGIISITTFKD